MNSNKTLKNERSSVVWEPNIRKLIKKAAKNECRKEADFIRWVMLAWLRDKKYM